MFVVSGYLHRNVLFVVSKIYIFDNLIAFSGGSQGGEFLNKQLTKVAEKNFEAGKVYAVELEHLSVFDKAKHCASIISYRKISQ